MPIVINRSIRAQFIMRTLLVCTDFSDPALHAASYAIMLANQYNLPNITLFHAYQSFFTATALPLDLDEEEERAKAVHIQLQELRKTLEGAISGDTRILVRAEKLSLGENINQICEEEGADMIVMGVAGKSKFERGMIGSNAINVSQNSRYPVCLVPAKASLEPVTHVLLACDLDELRRSKAIGRLDTTLAFLSAKLTVLNIGKNISDFPSQQWEEFPILPVLEKYDPHYQSLSKKDVAQGILDYAHDNNMSMVLAIPKHYNFFQQIVHRSATNQLIYQSSVPVLTLHE